MQALFLTVTLSLIAALQAQYPRSFSEKKQNITGTWYVKAIVADKLLKNRPKKLSPVTMTPLDSGDLESSYTTIMDGRCHKTSILLKRTKKPKKYWISGLRVILHIHEVPVKDHVIFYFYYVRRRPGRGFRQARLMGRNPDMNLDALEAFKKFVQGKRISEKYISIPALVESCVPESQ